MGVQVKVMGKVMQNESRFIKAKLFFLFEFEPPIFCLNLVYAQIDLRNDMHGSATE
jgi:hypothetical protein